jgi:hypothetical protein
MRSYSRSGKSGAQDPGKQLIERLPVQVRRDGMLVDESASEERRTRASYAASERSKSNMMHNMPKLRLALRLHQAR